MLTLIESIELIIHSCYTVVGVADDRIQLSIVISLHHLMIALESGHASPPRQEHMQIFWSEGLRQGFRIGVWRGMPSTRLHSDVVTEYITKEVGKGRLIGPLPLSMESLLHMSLFSVS